MKFHDEFEKEPKNGLPLVYTGIGVSIFVLLTLGVVLWMNQKPVKEATAIEGTIPQETIEEKHTEDLISGSTLTSDDLDIWDEKKKDETSHKPNSGNQKEETVTEDKKEVDVNANKTKIINEKGKEEWLTILPYLKKNTYDYEGLVFNDPIMKYFKESQKASYMGVDVSKYQTIVDYNKLKKAGVEFVMVRLGARGYGSGKLVLDDYFKDNMNGAIGSGLEVGVYFFSQAVTEEEAVEEANMVIENLKEFTVNYPVAFDMEIVADDTQRIALLNKEQRTKIATAFLDKIKEAGYKPMLYGDKEWLLAKVDLALLEQYDIWLSQESDVPDFPYRFAMWQYSTQGSIDGIAGKADLNISFIDYSIK